MTLEAGSKEFIHSRNRSFGGHMESYARSPANQSVGKRRNSSGMEPGCRTGDRTNLLTSKRTP